MKEILELNGSKYVVFKVEDMNKALYPNDLKIFVRFLQSIDGYRITKLQKPINRYLVLNLCDMIDLEYLVKTIYDKYSLLGKKGLYDVRIDKLSIDLVNAVLKYDNSH